MKITGFYATSSKKRQAVINVGSAAYIAAKIALIGKL
jgi:hypothetical protein